MKLEYVKMGMRKGCKGILAAPLQMDFPVIYEVQARLSDLRVIPCTGPCADFLGGFLDAEACR